MSSINITDDGNSTNNNNNNKELAPKEKIPKYTKVFIENPFDNRNIILKIAKNQKGVYVWQDNKHIYVGHSINLYNRITSYFVGTPPSILKAKSRRVLRYFNKYGFKNASLTIYIMNENSTLDEIVKLEQYFIDTLFGFATASSPNLNVDLVASSSGYHEPMSQEIRDRLREQRGTSIFVYDSEDFTLLHIFKSKQHIYDTINIHHKTLSNCLNLGEIYLDTFFLSLDFIEESTEVEAPRLLSLEEIKKLVSNKRDIYGEAVKHPASKGIFAEFKDDPSKNLIFPSLNSLAVYLKGDRSVIRDYLKGTKSGYYRGKWKFTYKD